MTALTAISSLYLGLPNDILPALTQLDAAEYVAGNIEDIGLDYMVSAARYGDVSSMVFLAKAFDSGLNLGKDRSQSYSQAVDWYQKAVNNGAEKRYLLMARMAEIMMMEDSGKCWKRLLINCSSSLMTRSWLCFNSFTTTRTIVTFTKICLKKDC